MNNDYTRKGLYSTFLHIAAAESRQQEFLQQAARDRFAHQSRESGFLRHRAGRLLILAGEALAGKATRPAQIVFECEPAAIERAA